VLYKNGKFLRKRQEYFASNSKRITESLNREKWPGPGTYNLNSITHKKSKTSLDIFNVSNKLQKKIVKGKSLINEFSEPSNFLIELQTKNANLLPPINEKTVL